MFKKFGPFCVFVCLPACLLADFSYEQTTKMTGGTMMAMMKFAGAFSKQAREPITASVAVKGNRMVHWRKDNADIIDLDSETITHVDFAKKQYSVITFAEMTQMMNQSLQQMKDKKNESNPEVSTDFKVDVKETGQTKPIAGYDAKELLMSFQMAATDEKTGDKGGMLVTSSMWIASNVAGYEEMREFHKKMAMKLVWTPGGASMMAGRPDIARGMAGMYKAAAKLDGVPVLQIMKMNPTGPDGQPISAPAGSETTSEQSKPKPETPSISGALAGRLGGFGGFGRKKKPEQPKEEPKQESAQSSPAPTAGSDGALMEMTTEMSGFSTAAVDPSKFTAPGGFKKVESEALKRR
jgi:hypothetical protein